MVTFVAVILLCTVPGILSGIFHTLLLKESNLENKIKTIVVYIGLFYGALSFVQMILGRGSMSLAESFRDASPTVCLYYILPFVLLSAIIPLLMKKISRYADISQYISLSASVMFAVLSLWFAVFNRIYNTFYVAVLLISALAAYWGINYYKGEISFFTKEDVRRRIRYAVPITFFYVATGMFFLPGTLFISNRSEMSFSGSSFAAALLAGTVIQMVLMAGVGIFLLTRRQFDFVYTVLFALSVSGYLQNNMLNGHMEQMDGGRQIWQGAQLYINFLIWIILIAGIVLVKRLVRKNIAKVYSMICIYLCLAQIASLGYLSVRAAMQDSEGSAGRWVLSQDSIFTLHPDKNVLVFVVDWYDEQILEKVLREDESFLSSLDGFTCYTNATSLYSFTEMSVPYLLTGIEWQYDMDRDRYVKYAYENSAMMDDISAAGYDIGIYTESTYVYRNVSDKLLNCLPYTELADTQDCDTWNTIELMLRCSKYQMMPFGIKNWYWYSSDEIDALRGDDQIIYSTRSVDDDAAFRNSLNTIGLAIDHNATDSGSYRFYHLYGAHPPYYTADTGDISLEEKDMIAQARDGMGIVLEYIEQLKRLGLYDSATIIITADHGQHYLYVPWRETNLSSMGLDKTSNPILLVKNSGDTWDGIKQSGAPVTHTEVVSDIVHAMNPQVSAKYGRTLQEIGEKEDRVRTMIYWRSDLPYVKYSINGNARDESSWSVAEIIESDDR